METRSFNSSPTLSLQRSYERLQVEADRLFDIGWLIARLTVELRQMLSAEPAPTPSQFFGSLRRDAERWFVWEMLHQHTKSIARILDLQQLFPERDLFIRKLQEEREQQIDQFSQLLISKRWDTLRDDDTSWRKFAKVMFGLSETPETSERFFALTDYIHMLTLVILGKEQPYLNDTADPEPSPTETTDTPAPGLIATRAELKLFLRQEWFDKFSTDKKRFTMKWREDFVNALLDSDCGEAIIADYTNETHDRKLIVKGVIVGCLKAEKVLDGSDLSIARTILYPNGVAQDQAAVAEAQTKAKTLSSYIGQYKKQKHEKIYYWIQDWVETHPAET
jgi:hypothetical protein